MGKFDRNVRRIGIFGFILVATGAQTVSAQPFVHPGGLHTQPDFDRMAAKVAMGAEPWTSGWNRLTSNPHAQLSWVPRPVEIVYRGTGYPENYSRLYNDIAAAYQNALRYQISGDTRYADKAVEIMNAWSYTLTSIQGSSDKFLAAGIYGYQFANVGEMMRNYSGWSAAEFAQFQNMMLNIFYPMNHDFIVRHNGACISHYWANWDACNMASMIAIAVLADRRDLYDEAVNYFKTGAGNGANDKLVSFMHPGYLGQWQESGRDQGHATLGMALMGPFFEVAWNQGDDLYGWDNSRFLAGSEYVAKYNLGYEVPYVTYDNCDNVDQVVISSNGRGSRRPAWEMLFNHYVNRRGLMAPYSEEFAARVRPEGGGGDYGTTSGGYDQLGFGTLTYTLDPIPSATVPSGLSAIARDLQLTLSWWGVPAAASYDVKRAQSSGGPYATIANVTANTYTDLDVASGETYYYVVSALGSNAGPNSNEAMGTAQCIPTISASSHSGPGGSQSADRAFDGRIDTKWYTPTTAPGWLQYSVGGRGTVLQTIVGYALTSANDVPQRDPMDWEFQGSLDGQNWTTLDARTGEMFSTRFQTKEYTIGENCSFAHYRLNITANRGGAAFGIQLAELTLR